MVGRRCDGANARIAASLNLLTFKEMAMSTSAASHLLPVFARVDLGFSHGEGCYLFATNGDRYLDFTSGVAVNALGHAHPVLVKALQEQATKLWHMSNLFKSPDGEVLASRLCEQSFADLVFFCNSGAEAMEGVIKLVRHHHFSKGHPERYRIITFEGAFHGRTLATLAATGAAKYLEGYGPSMDGFDQVPHGDLEAVKKAIGPHTAGILIEPVQGEGGVRSAPHAFYKALRELCDQHGLLLAFDEVQTGMGRTGDLFAYKRLGCRRQCRARCHAQARLLRSCAEDVSLVEAEARFRRRSLPCRARRSARRRLADRREGRGALG